MTTPKTLVIVDDEPPVTTLFGALFRRRGFNVHAFTDGNILLEWLATNACDAFLIDLQMPKLDGFTLLCMLREKYPNVPVIIFSGLPCTLEEEAALISAGAAGFIHKTSPFEEGVAVVTDLTREKRPAKRLQVTTGRLSQISAVLTRRIQRISVPSANDVPVYAGG